MSTQHTPGPWMAPPHSNEVMTMPSGEVKICRVYPVSAIDDKETNANARLITAAPEMLKALQDLVHAHDVGMGKTAVQLRIDIAKDAIKKAQP